MKHFLSIQDFSLDDIIENILKLAFVAVTDAREQRCREPLYLASRNAKVTLLFREPSTRTLSSYREAAELLGFRVQEISGVEATSFMKKESFADGVRTLAEEGANILVIRDRFEGAPRFAAEVLDRMGYSIPVHNAGDGANRHPTQAILNALTILRKLGRLHDFTVGFLGDLRYSRTIHSDLDMLKLLMQKHGDIRLKAVSAPEAALLPSQKMGLAIEESDSLEILRDCHVVMATRIQEERYPDKNEAKKVMGRFMITRQVLDSMMDPDVIIMHPLPRGLEIAPEISEDQRVVMWEQMGYGVPARMALLRLSYTGRNEAYAPLSIPESELTTLDEEGVESRLAKREAKYGADVDRYFRPIRERGMVIDHLPVGAGDRVKHLLRDFAGLRGDEGCIHLLEGMKVKKGTPEEHRKDALVLEGQYIGKEFYGIITFMVPDVTFNVIREGTFTKCKSAMPERLPAGIFLCPNEVCITNNDPEARARFAVHSDGQFVSCYYCNRIFSREEILKKF